MPENQSCSMIALRPAPNRARSAGDPKKEAACSTASRRSGQDCAASVAVPVADFKAPFLVFLVPGIGDAVMAVFRFDVATLDPNVMSMLPMPIPRRPDIALALGRHGLLANGRRGGLHDEHFRFRRDRHSHRSCRA